MTLAVAELPSIDDEVWRYSRIADLDLDRYEPVGAAPAEGLPDAGRHLVEGIGGCAGVVVLRDGHLAHVSLGDAATAAGLTVTEAPRRLGHEPDAFVGLAGERSPSAVVIALPAGKIVEEPLVVVQWTETAGGASFPRVAVDLAGGSQLTVVERVASADVEALSVPVVETQVGDGAVLRWLSIQELGRQVWQLGYHRSVVGVAGSLLTAGIALGGDYARTRLDVDLAGEGSRADLVAVYFSDGSQTHDFRTLQDHHGRKSSSDLLFKGAVAGEANAVYTGLIRVNPGAAGTSAYLTNRNIVLSPDARVDSVPNLDIVHESDVQQCGHASASGPIDADQRFYLESRGVPTDVAERLIVMGFFEDVFRRLPVPTLLQGLHDAVAAKLEGVIR